MMQPPFESFDAGYVLLVIAVIAMVIWAVFGGDREGA